MCAPPCWHSTASLQADSGMSGRRCTAECGPAASTRMALGGCKAALGAVLVALALLAQLPGGEARVTRRLLTQVKVCRPLDVAPEERCDYVREQDACQPDDGFINYLEIHYCFLDQL